MNFEIDYTSNEENSCTSILKNKSQKITREEILSYSIPDQIAARASELYKLIADDKIHRESPRRRLQYFSVYCAYFEFGHKVDPILLGRRMSLTREDVQKAFTDYGINDRYKMRVIICTPPDFIIEHCEAVSIDINTARHILQNVTHFCSVYPEILEMNPCRASIALIAMFFIDMHSQKNAERGRANEIPLTIGACKMSIDQFANTLCMTSAALNATIRSLGVIFNMNNKPIRRRMTRRKKNE
jgi:hypothetical protein